MELKTLINYQFGGSNIFTRSNIFDFVLLIVFIGILIFYFYFKYTQWENREVYINKNFTTIYYPESCPDYWVSDTDKGSNYCKNVNSSNNSSITEFDFSDSKYTGLSNGNLNKCLWANSNDIPWTGIDNLC